MSRERFEKALPDSCWRFGRRYRPRIHSQDFQPPFCPRR